MFGVPNSHISKLLAYFFMQQMLLCISYCILNHSDNQESIHLFARERSMNTHTHRYFLRQKRTIKQHSNIWNELWPLLKTTQKKKAPPQNNNQQQARQSSGRAHRNRQMCSNKTPLAASYSQVTWKILRRWATYIHVLYDL